MRVDRMLAVQGIAVYLAVRVVVVVALLVAVKYRQVKLEGTLARFDGGFYQAIARDGYPDRLPLSPSGEPAASTVAFFPGYPMATSAVATLGLPTTYAAVLVSVIAGAVAAALIAQIAAVTIGRPAAVPATLLWCVQPMAFILSAAYAEALFTALAAVCLWALLGERWLTAGSAALAAGLTRPTGAALTLAVLTAAVLSARRSGGRRQWVAVALAPVGLVGYVTWVGVRVGRVDAWFATQRGGWHTSFDAGASTLGRAWEHLADPLSTPTANAVTATIAAATALAVLMIRDRLPWPLIVYALTILVLAIGARNLFVSIPRFLLPAFPLLFPLAARLSRLRRRLLIPLGTLAAAASATLGATWLTTFSYAP